MLLQMRVIRRSLHLFADYLAANMYGEPDCVWIGPLNSMSHMARNHNMIARVHPDELSPLEFQTRFAAHHNDPFVFILIVPKAGRAAVRLRNDTLDLNRMVFEQAQRLFRIEKLLQVRK